MLSYAFHHCVSAGISHGKTLACHTVYKDFSTCGAVKCNVTHNHIVFCTVMPVFRWINHQFASGKTFSVIVVGISFQIQGQSLWNKGAEALPPEPLQFTVSVSSGSPFLCCLVISAPKIVPKVLSVLLTSTDTEAFSPFFRAVPSFFSSTFSSRVFSSWKS